MGKNEEKTKMKLEKESQIKIDFELIQKQYNRFDGWNLSNKKMTNEILWMRKKSKQMRASKQWIVQRVIN